MEKYNCVLCGRELEITMAQITIIENDKFYGSLCVSCGDSKEVELIDVWKVGNDELGWFLTNNYSEAFETILNDCVESEIEIVKDRMLNVEYEKLPEFDGF